MAKYYVIKSNETGLYFRGKGVNRWGKHFNQASIYRVRGTAEHNLKEIARHGEQAEIVEIQIVEAPTVDAVEVCRCKDCLHYELGVFLKIYSDGNVSADAWQERKPDDFCSYGERREGE